MKKIIALALAAFIGVTAPAVALGQNTYDDYNYNYNYDDYNYNYNYDDYYYDDYNTISDESAAALGIGILIFAGIASLIGLALFIFWIVMLVDLFKREFEQKNTWMIVMLVGFFLGFWWLAAIVYYFMVKRKNLGHMTKSSGTPPSTPPATPPSTPPAQS